MTTKNDAWRTPEHVKAVNYRSWHKRQEIIFGVSYPTFWLCDICNRPISGSNIQLDHNHKTGAFRGWLCRRCNVALGYLEIALSLPNLLRYVGAIQK